jgi:4-amino-4-deoxy-L-arabinose transferase-like glycosyltransferase
LRTALHTTSKAKQLLLLNIVLLAIYFSVFANLRIGISDETMFRSPDAKEYLNESTLFYTSAVGEFSDTRPFFYPLFLRIIYHSAGVYGAWLAQLLMWLGAINLIYLTAKCITASNTFSFAAALLMALNLSLIAFTLHALTEVITVFFLSLLLYFISANLAQRRSTRFIHGCLLLLSILTVIKPLFYLPLLFTVFIIVPLFYFRQYLQRPMKIITLFLVLLPLFIQLTIMKVKHNELTVSTISTLTLRNYIVSQVIEEQDQIKWEDAQTKARGFSSGELTKYISDHRQQLSRFYFHNLRDNVMGAPAFLQWPEDHPLLAKLMYTFNKIYFYLHLLLLLPAVIAIWSTLKQKRADGVPLLVSLLLLAYIIFTSGISFMQGDRLVLCGLPLWIMFHVLTVWMTWKKYRGAGAREANPYL